MNPSTLDQWEKHRKYKATGYRISIGGTIVVTVQVRRNRVGPPLNRDLSTVGHPTENAAAAPKTRTLFWFWSRRGAGGWSTVRSWLRATTNASSKRTKALHTVPSCSLDVVIVSSKPSPESLLLPSLLAGIYYTSTFPLACKLSVQQSAKQAKYTFLLLTRFFQYYKFWVLPS
jgi:hypothetical protein